MVKFLKCALLMSGIFLLSSAALAQFTLLDQKNGDVNYRLLGKSVAGIGDVDSDGVPDYVIGVPSGGNYPNFTCPLIYVYSGKTGNLLYQRRGPDYCYYTDISISRVGDVDGDGKPDFIVGFPNGDPYYSGADTACVFSGTTGNIIYRVSSGVNGIGPPLDGFGLVVAGIGDVNGDGVPDFAVGAPFANPGGRQRAGAVYVYSGNTGLLYYEIDGQFPGDSLGYSIAGVGDIDGDGRADFIIGAPFSGPQRAGSILVYSGKLGNLLFRKDGDSTGEGFGWSVAALSDINGDGRLDFLVGAPGGVRNFTGINRIFIYSGADNSLLFSRDSVGGFSAAGTGDVDGDGIPDFVVGNPFVGYGLNRSVVVLSGCSARILYQKDGAEYSDFLGYSLAGIGDINGDDRADILVGAPYASPESVSNAGSAYVYGLDCSSIKGDMNTDSALTPSDVVLMLNCVFLSAGNCESCFADVNYDGDLTASDAVMELNAVFLSTPITCRP